MKQKIQNEKGYTLVLTLFVILLFTIVGASLMAATIGGAQKNKIRETDIQATELANNGVEYLTAQINTELKNALGKTGLPRNEFKTLLENTLNKYKDKNNPISRNGATGDYYVYIEDYKDTKNNDLRKIVTFISKGKANNNQKAVRSDIEIGAQSVLETLKYAVGANKCPEGKTCESLPGEGNMFLHGGITIQGDFKVDNNLIITDRGYAYLGGERWIESLYPSILPSQGATEPSLVLGGNVYTFSHSPTYSNHIASTSFGSSYANRTNNLSSAFYNNNYPVIVKREVTRDEINIGEQKSVYYFPVDQATTVLNGSDFSNNLNYPTQKVYPSNRTCTTEWVWIVWPIYGQNVEKCSQSYDGNYTLAGNNYFGNFATLGSLTIKSSTAAFKETRFNSGAYIEKDLTIGNGATTYDVSKYDKLRIDGPLYVNGDVTIKGANVEFNSIMYVAGNVVIENSQLNGLGTNGSLIIFAKGNINIRNNSVNMDSPSNIKGFFYSEQALEIFGVGSNIRIEGGVSARRIVLNAIRGKASNINFTGAQRITSTDYFEGRAYQPSKTSRLQIIYDSNIMNTYADIKSREPIVKNVDLPLLINRQ